MTTATTYPFVTTVHRPGLPDIHIGFAYRHDAEMGCVKLTSQLTSCQHVPGTTISWGPTSDGISPLDPLPRCASTLAELIEQEPAHTGDGHGFPDLYSRLSAQETHDIASRLWRDAIYLLCDNEES